MSSTSTSGTSTSGTGTSGTGTSGASGAATGSRLFEPAHVGRLHLPNRLVMAPLTRNRAAADGTPRPIMADYYAQRASAGLIIAEATTPNAVGRTYPGIPAIYSAGHVAGWRRVTDAVRAEGGRMFLQVQHGGRIGHPDNSGLHPVAPSAVRFPDTIHTPGGSQPGVVPREMTLDEIRSTVADFAAAARNAVDAGFDGVEVHGANGYLIHQFLARGTNHRTDAYGGSVSARVRFAVEVVRAVADAIGPERVGLRVAPGFTGHGIDEGDTAAIYPALLGELDDLGLAYLHVVWADPGTPLFHALRGGWRGTLIANPALPWPAPFPVDGGRREAERLLDAGADLVSLGRAFLANPDLVERLRRDAPLNPMRDEYWYGGGETGYTDYPTLRATSGQPAAPVPPDASATPVASGASATPVASGQPGVPEHVRAPETVGC
ncbi:oxidoreductase [Actinomadura fibrosa]|uniref:Alkene reductase n=1 Tax=Actinomadura fibrosa TaxID=111802 RepID=A0ABW2XCT2_9ACTN|nr:alkene reductase [Actinomadura fibrosa]